MTREEYWKIVEAVTDAHKDNEMGGKYAKAFNHGVQSAFNRVCKALKDIEQQQQPNRCDSCTHSEEQDGSNCYECVKGMADNFEAQPSEDCISRQAVLDVINFEDKWLFDANGHNANTHIAFSGLESRVKALPSVTPSNADTREAYIKGYDYGVKDWFKDKTQPCEDCISRQAALDTIGNVPDYDDGMVWEALSHAQRDVALLPSVTPKGVTVTDFADKCRECGKIQNELAEDAVSRSELLSHDFIITAQNGISHRVIYATRVEEAPSVIPQRKMGKWIFNEKLGHQYCCSECGNPMPTVNDYYRAKLIGCPYCLADMREGNK